MSKDQVAESREGESDKSRSVCLASSRCPVLPALRTCFQWLKALAQMNGRSSNFLEGTFGTNSVYLANRYPNHPKIFKNEHGKFTFCHFNAKPLKPVLPKCSTCSYFGEKEEGSPMRIYPEKNPKWDKSHTSKNRLTEMSHVQPGCSLSACTL